MKIGYSTLFSGYVFCCPRKVQKFIALAIFAYGQSQKKLNGLLFSEIYLMPKSHLTNITKIAKT